MNVFANVRPIDARHSEVSSKHFWTTIAYYMVVILGAILATIIMAVVLAALIPLVASMHPVFFFFMGLALSGLVFLGYQLKKLIHKERAVREEQRRIQHRDSLWATVEY